MEELYTHFKNRKVFFFVAMSKTAIDLNSRFALRF